MCCDQLIMLAVSANGLRTHRTRDTSAPRQFGPNGEIVRPIGPDASVLGPGHFGTSADVLSVQLLRLLGNIAETVHSLKILRTLSKQRRCLHCLQCVDCAKFNAVNRYPYPTTTLQNLFKIKVGYLLIRLLTDITQIRLRELH